MFFENIVFEGLPGKREKGHPSDPTPILLLH